MGHDGTWKLETEPRQDIQMSRLSQDRDMKKHVCINTVSRQDTCLETPSMVLVQQFFLILVLVLLCETEYYFGSRFSFCLLK